MIAYAELERALKRWKARQSGADPNAAEEEHQEITAEAVVSEVYAEVPAVELGGSGPIQVEFDSGDSGPRRSR
jgi:hypothetical protein